MKTIKTTENVTKVDIVKAGNAVSTAKDIIGTPFKLYAVILAEKEDVDEQSGEIKKQLVTIIKTDMEESFVSSISPTLKSSAENLLDNFSTEDFQAGIPCVVKSKKSNHGRDFVYIDLQ